MANNCKQFFNPGVSMRTISPTATPLPTAYDCVAVYIAGRRTNLVVFVYFCHISFWFCLNDYYVKKTNYQFLEYLFL